MNRVWQQCKPPRVAARVVLTLALTLGMSMASAPAGAAGMPGPGAAAPERDVMVRRATELINTIRRKLDACGANGLLAPGATADNVPDRPPLRWNDRLADAARDHADAMVNQRFFSHVAPDGGTVGDRVSRRGYRWRQVGENLAAGLVELDAAVREWLLSPTHCAVLIGERFTEFGIAQVRSEQPADPYRIYWALVVAEPR